MARDPLEYFVADDLVVAELAGALAPDFDLRVESAATAQRGFYDTFDGRLHRAGFCLTREDCRLTLRDGRVASGLLQTARAPRGGFSWPIFRRARCASGLRR